MITNSGLDNMASVALHSMSAAFGRRGFSALVERAIVGAGSTPPTPADTGLADYLFPLEAADANYNTEILDSGVTSDSMFITQRVTRHLLLDDGLFSYELREFGFEPTEDSSGLTFRELFREDPSDPLSTPVIITLNPGDELRLVLDLTFTVPFEMVLESPFAPVGADATVGWFWAETHQAMIANPAGPIWASLWPGPLNLGGTPPVGGYASRLALFDVVDPTAVDGREDAISAGFIGAFDRTNAESYQPGSYSLDEMFTIPADTAVGDINVLTVSRAGMNLMSESGPSTQLFREGTHVWSWEGAGRPNSVDIYAVGGGGSSGFASILPIAIGQARVSGGGAGGSVDQSDGISVSGDLLVRVGAGGISSVQHAESGGASSVHRYAGGVEGDRLVNAPGGGHGGSTGIAPTQDGVSGGTDSIGNGGGGAAVASGPSAGGWGLSRGVGGTGVSNGGDGEGVVYPMGNNGAASGGGGGAGGDGGDAYKTGPPESALAPGGIGLGAANPPERFWFTVPNEDPLDPLNWPSRTAGDFIMGRGGPGADSRDLVGPRDNYGPPNHGGGGPGVSIHRPQSSAEVPIDEKGSNGQDGAVSIYSVGGAVVSGGWKMVLSTPIEKPDTHRLEVTFTREWGRA